MKNLTKEIDKLRKKIDFFDKKIIYFLEKRGKIVDKILKEKIKNNLSLTDEERERKILENLKRLTQNQDQKILIDLIYPLIFNFGKRKALFLKEKDIPFFKVGILGLGAIGGSIAKALKIKNKKIKIYSLKEERRDLFLSQKEKVVDRLFEKLSSLLENIDLLILSSPIKTIIDLAKKIKKEKIDHPLVVIDVSSVKEDIVREFLNLTSEKVDFLGTHPMAGTLGKGFSSANPFIFVGKPWIITPHQKNKQENIEKIKKFISYLGAVPFIFSAKKHDQKVALVSHLNIFLSWAIYQFVSQDKEALKITGTSYKLMTRLVQVNNKMHQQIIKNNKKNIQETVKKFIKFLKKPLFKYKLVDK